MAYNAPLLKEILVLLSLGIVGAVCVVPYSVSIIRIRRPGRAISPLSISTLIVVQNAALLSITIPLGLRTAHAQGLGAGLLEGVLAHVPDGQVLGPMLVSAVMWGTTASCLALVVDAMFLSSALSESIHHISTNIPLWRRLLASVYGGANEEIYSRLFLLSSSYWVISKAWPSEHADSILEFWIANVIVAVTFGVAHLPATSALLGLSARTVSRALILNGLASLVFGWLYWRFGLEAAMIGHFSADVVLQIGEWISNLRHRK